MESKRRLNWFEEVHKRAQDAIAHARQIREKDAELRKKEAENEAVREGFDRCLIQDLHQN
jgi:hypothetical protein